ncbi:5,10-methylene-tetrahydrofolate dehydrogenase/methenyl tetrahydrofolate cyclohydrolase [Inquilinus ginsengisoli]
MIGSISARSAKPPVTPFASRMLEDQVMTSLNGTVSVVTGAGRGIGREIALHQARAGARVAVLARTAREIERPER